jgi:Ig-like domain from next to BRCA1 gene
MINQARIFFLLLCLTILVGCSIPFSTTPGSFPEPTHIYQTVSAGLTATAAATQVSKFTQAVSDTFTPAPTSLVNRITPPVQTVYPAPFSPSKTALPCNRSSAGKPSIDVTISDGTSFKPGEPFSKTWRLVNSGSCTWTREYSLVWFSGESFSSIHNQYFANEIPGGQSVDIMVDMVAPDKPGIHQTNWKLRAADGSLFGLGPTGDSPIWVRIEVIDSGVVSENITPTLTPTSIVAMKDTVVLELNQNLDLDIGKINSSEAADLGIIGNGTVPASLTAVNGARIGIFGSQNPTEADCRVATLTSDGIPLNTIPENTYICYRTNQGLPGFGKLSNITENSLVLFYTTWLIP